MSDAGWAAVLVLGLFATGYAGAKLKRRLKKKKKKRNSVSSSLN